MPSYFVQLDQHRSPRYRRWRGRLIHPLDEARLFFQNQGPVLDALHRLTERLNAAGIPFLLLGGFAVRAHGHNRTTEDVNVCMRAVDLDRFRREFVGVCYAPVLNRSRRFFEPETDVSVHILVTGETAGRRDKQTEVKFPDPSESQQIDGLPVPSLARLVELKLVTWRYKDWADVVELIRIHNPDESFVEQVHRVARPFYLQCYDQKLEEDRYNPEIHDPPADDNAG